MNCLNDGVLRTFLDGELRGSELESAETHLRNCESCGARLRAIQSQTNSVQKKIATLGQEPAGIDAHPAYERFQEASSGRGTASRFRMAWPRPAIGWAAAAVIALLLLGFSPGRTWAQIVLAMLRVQKVAVVQVDLSSLTAQNAEGEGGAIVKFMSDNVVITMKPGEPVTVADAATAGQMAGFSVRPADSLGTPKVLVNDQGAFQMTLNRDRLQALVDAVGRTDIQIPASVDGSLVAVHVPKMVVLQYGICGQPANTLGCINFAQVPSPTVSVPPSLNVAALAETALQLAGMSAADAHTFAQNIDWTSTLVLPVPRGDSSFRTVPVDGVNGTLIESLPRGNYVGHYELIWIKNGIVYTMGGAGTSDRALAAAGSLS
jgi:hypothetical protein